MIKKSLGIIETKGLITALQAADAAVKAANVRIASFSIVGSGLVAVLMDGDVASVQAAVKAGTGAIAATSSGAGGQSGELIASNVIPRPHKEVNRLITMLELT